eukprot:TRINITY_DN29850_c0_g1_i1.p1 TRINITY_DN29850_c0_g1~~TRINITY_DN29850_c0_g1_i1.p1  ORF type:complete len:402 (+),score=79.46 TRINITY_DN29850_c0_g1_i1:221-1426(+)
MTRAGTFRRLWRHLTTSSSPAQAGTLPSLGSSGTSGVGLAGPLEAGLPNSAPAHAQHLRAVAEGLRCFPGTTATAAGRETGSILSYTARHGQQERNRQQSLIQHLSLSHRAFSNNTSSSRALSSWAGGHSDIGARARALQQRRLWTLALGTAGAAGSILAVLSAFQENLTFYITPTQAVEKFGGGTALAEGAGAATNAPQKRKRFRLGGLVLEGSIRRFAGSTEMEFVVTDLATDILVRYRGALPDLFREGHSVVAEGFLQPMALASTSSSPPPTHSSVSAAAALDAPPPAMECQERARSLHCFFTATEVLAKHDERYMPKEVAAAVERNKAAAELEQAAAALLQEEAGEGSPVASAGPRVLEPPPAPLLGSGGGKGGASKKNSKVAQAPVTALGYDGGVV